MDSNLSLSVGFKGTVKPKAQAVPLQEGYLKLGGIVDTTQTTGLKFGVVCSAAADDPTSIVAGKGSGNVIRGIVVFDDAIAQNSPAHPDSYLPGMPCSFISKGLVRFDSWVATETNQIEPVIGCQVEYNDTTGAVGFVAAGGSADSSNTLLTGATVVEVSDTGAYIWLA